MNEITADDRSLWFRDVRRVLDIAEAGGHMPPVYITSAEITFQLYAFLGHVAVRALAEMEVALSAALGAGFAARVAEEHGATYYYLTAELPSGLKLHLKAWASDVADRKVTGQMVTDLVQWVRLPVEEPEPAEAGTAAAS